MTTIVTRTGKGSPLTHVEVDTNFTNLNTAKLEAGAIALGSAAASISFTGDTNTGVFSPGADTIAVSTGGTGRLFADSSGRLLVGTSTANTSGAKLQTSDGLTFPATQVASADANTLDDYEEGTWTADIAGQTGTAFTQSSSYTKIGRIVYLSTRISISSWGTTSGAGQIAITGLPFTAASSIAGTINVRNAYAKNTSQLLYPDYGGGGTLIAFFKTTAAGVETQVSISDMNGNSVIILDCWYAV